MSTDKPGPPKKREVSISGADICNSAIFASTEFQQVKSAASEESLQHREISQRSKAANPYRQLLSGVSVGLRPTMTFTIYQQQPISDESRLPSELPHGAIRPEN